MSFLKTSKILTIFFLIPSLLQITLQIKLVPGQNNLQSLILTIQPRSMSAYNPGKCFWSPQ